MKSVLTVLAYVMLAVGIVSMVTPMPGGTLLIAGGCALLICTSERAAGKIASVRAGKPWVNKPMFWLEEKMGERLSAPMRSTRPDVLQDINQTDSESGK